MYELTPQQVSILRCPVCHSKLRPADARLLTDVNAAQAAGKLLTRLSEIVALPVESGLVNDDCTLLYPIRNGMLLLLASEAIEIWEWHPDGRGSAPL